MREFHLKKLKSEPLYDYDPWKVVEKEFKVENNHHNESIFSLGNGYMGLRGFFEEDYTGPEETHTPGIYINGVYGSERIIYGEDAPNQPEKTQTIVNLADWTSINFFIDGEKFDIFKGEIIDYDRTLDMKSGLLKRSLVWKSPAGRKLRVESTRLISLKYQHNAVINYSIIPLNFKDKIRVISSIKGDVQNHHHFRDKNVLETINQGFGKEGSGYLLQKVSSTNIDVCTAINHEFKGDYERPLQVQASGGENTILYEIKFDAEPEKEFKLIKYITAYTSYDIARSRLVNRTVQSLLEGMERGFSEFVRIQKEFLDRYWYDVDVKIEGAPYLQQALRFNAFQMLQSTGRDGFTNVPAKGLTGEFYEGHYFWDTETFILPFYLYNRPEMARRLLIYRYNILDKARINASRVKLDGALYPWRTINGYEASGFFMGSTVQYHIDADVAYAIYRYVKATDDYDFLYNIGAEILFETARMWASLGSYIKEKENAFCFNVVCGPDEYKPGVNNNCYTNYMAKFNLEYALEVVELMKEEVPEIFDNIKQKIALNEHEIVGWKDVAQKIFLPYDEELGINPQDDSFLYKKPIDIESIPHDELPLVNNWHPLTIWRYQVIKQADVVLLMFLLGDKFSFEEKKRNYDFYEPRTTHDSSLSPAVYSILASEIGYFNDAYDYFIQIARLDLDNFNENTYQGIHAAAMGSAWMAVVFGFAGMRNGGDNLRFNPYLPAEWDAYEFTIKYKGKEILLRVDEKGAHYQLIKGENMIIKHRGEEIKITKEETTVPKRKSTKLKWNELLEEKK